MHLMATPVMPHSNSAPRLSILKNSRGPREALCSAVTLQRLATAVLVTLLVGVFGWQYQSWRRSPRALERHPQMALDGRSELPSCVPVLPKRILLWTTFWGNQSEQWEKIFFRQVSRQCPVSSCEIVYDHRNFDTADAVLFHLLDFLNTTELPSSRPTGQQWVLFSLEAPPVVNAIPVDYARLNGAINWTMTYRRDSDIVVPYGMVTPTKLLEAGDNYDWESQIESPSPHEGPTWDGVPDRDYWAEKSPDRMVSWMVSHCATDGRREWFAKELVKHIKVDVFGRCGFKKCGRNISIKTLGSFDQEACNQEISSYYFYLAFENSICEDYVTEKFFMALKLNVIPVVFGGADYNAIAPPRSYINALEFASPGMLAKALTALASNRTLYNSFFAWKKHYTVELGHPFLPMVCDLCARLHGAPVRQRPLQTSANMSPDGLKTRAVGRDRSSGSYSDVEGWFVAGSSCRRWWAGPRDYMKHQQTGAGAAEPKQQDIISQVEEDGAENPVEKESFHYLKL